MRFNHCFFSPPGFRHRCYSARAVLLGALLLSSIGCESARGAAPASEARALWVTRWDYRTAGDVAAIVRNAADYYFNIILFQVRGEATVFYPSRIEPWAWELTGKSPETLGRNPGWDPLATAIALARQRGIELHAYINVLPAWKNPTPPPPSSAHILVRNPEWLMMTRAGKPMPQEDGFYTFLNPAHPAVKERLTQLTDELMRNYDIDGLHLDYIRYPDEYHDADLSYDPASLQAFRSIYHAEPDQNPAAWDQYRATQVSDVVRRIYQTVKARKPSAMVSSACVADYDKAVNICCQPSLDWLNNGDVDCLIPMNYTGNLELFRKRAESFAAGRKRGLIYMGMMAERGADAMREEIRISREMGFHGVSVFSYENLFPDHAPNALARMIRDEMFKTPARVTGRRYPD